MLEAIGDGEMTDQEATALERLEERILKMVEQLRDTRSRLREAEQDNARLREQLAEKEQALEALQAECGEAETERRAIRSRLESLLNRIETLES